MELALFDELVFDDVEDGFSEHVLEFYVVLFSFEEAGHVLFFVVLTHLIMLCLRKHLLHLLILILIIILPNEIRVVLRHRVNSPIQRTLKVLNQLLATIRLLQDP